MVNDELQRVRSQFAEEREKLKALDGRVTDQGLKWHLRFALDGIDDYERMFLGDALEGRSVSYSAQAAGRMLTIAREARVMVENAVREYGDNAVTLGG